MGGRGGAGGDTESAKRNKQPREGGGHQRRRNFSVFLEDKADGRRSNRLRWLRGDCVVHKD